MSAGGVRQAEWPGRGGQLREVGVLRPGIGDDQGRLGVSAGAGYGCRGRLGGFVAGGEDTNHYASSFVAESKPRSPPGT